MALRTLRLSSLSDKAGGLRGLNKIIRASFVDTLHQISFRSLMKHFLKTGTLCRTGYAPLDSCAAPENESSVAQLVPQLGDTDESRNSSEEVDVTLRRVPDSLPASIWLITAVEFGERFAYFGLNGPLQNYLQLASNHPVRPGGLGNPSHIV